MSAQQLIMVILCVLCIVPGSLLGADIVISKGVSFYEPGQEVLAREKAIGQAKRSAIEQAVGVKVTSVSAVKKFQAVRDDIFSHSQGYLRHVRILKEESTPYGAYEVTLEAEVETDALASDIDRFRELFMLQKNPRIITRIAPDLPPQLIPQAVNAKNILIDLLDQNGFVVLVPSLNSTSVSAALIAEIALDQSSSSSEYQGVSLTVNEVLVSALVKRSGDDTLLATSSARTTLPGENRIATLDRGVKYCVQSLWKDLKKKMIAVWDRELNAQRNLTVQIHNVGDVAAARNLISIIKEGIPSVHSITMLRLEKQTAVYTVLYAGYPDSFVAEIGLHYFKSQYADLETLSINNNYIVLKKRTI